MNCHVNAIAGCLSLRAPQLRSLAKPDGITEIVLPSKGAVVTIATRHKQDCISLTDMLKHFGDESILYNWLRNRNAIEFLGVWEQRL